jgi:hypothetical protein
VAARLIFNLRPRDHQTDAFLQLHWLPVQYRIIFKLCLLTHTAIVGRAPLNMSQAIIPVTYIQYGASLRSTTAGDLQAPRTRLKLGERAWRVAGPTEWNKLPADIKQIRDTYAFRRALKTYLFRLAFSI